MNPSVNLEKMSNHPILHSIFLGITVILIGLYPRITDLSVFSLLTVLLFVTGAMLLTGAFIKQKLLYAINSSIPIFAVMLLSVGLLILGLSFHLLALGIITGIVAGIIVSGFLARDKSSVVASIILIAGVIILPTILWPNLVPNGVIFTTTLLMSTVIGGYSVFAPKKSQAATYRLVVYNMWVIFIVYFALSFDFGFWATVIGMGSGAFLVILSALYIETLDKKSLWLMSQSQLPIWQSRSFLMSSNKPSEEEVETFKENLFEISETDCLNNSLSDRFLLSTRHSIEFYNKILDLLHHFHKEFLEENPKASQIALDALLDLPDSVTNRPIYLHIEQIIRLELMENLSKGENSKFNEEFISKVWPNFTKQRDNVIGNLRKSGELNKRLKSKPNDRINPPYSPNGVFLDYGEWSGDKPDADWQKMLAEDLHPRKILTDPDASRTTQDFLNWITKIKSLRDNLLKLIKSHDNNKSWQRHIEQLSTFGDRGLQEAFAFVNLLQSYQMYFEAIDLLEALKNHHPTFFTANAIDNKIAECEFNLFVQKGWGKKTEVKISKTSSKGVGNPQLKLTTKKEISISGRNIVLRTPDVSLFILLKNTSVQRFELPTGQTQVVTMSPGNYKIIIYPRNAPIAPIWSEWSVDSTDQLYNLLVEFAPNKQNQEA